MTDTTPPVVTASANADPVQATSLAGAVETFSSSTSDDVDGSSDPVIFTEELAGGGSKIVQSGDTFAVGAHTIVASATDAAGNTGSAPPFLFVVTPLVIVSGGGTPAPVTNQSLFGSITHDVTSAGGEIISLYQALLGRAPDPLELETKVAALETGAAPAKIARHLLGASDRHGEHAPTSQLSDGAFVDRLYEAALHRGADASERRGWETALAGGEPRAQVAVDIAFSAESQTDLAPSFEAGVFVPDLTASKIARLYYGLLDRAPDAGGLSAAETDLAQGASLDSLAAGLIVSPEYSRLHGSQSNAQFVDALFEGALGHPAGAGAASFVHALDKGASRASIAIGIAESPAAAAHLAPDIEQGFRLA